MLLSSIYPLGVYFPGVEGTALTRGRAWSPSNLLTVGRGQWEAEGKHRSATGPGGGGSESAAVGLAQCLGDGQTDTGPAVVPIAGGPPVEAFEDVSGLARWDDLAVIGDVDERGGRPLSVDANPDLPVGPGCRCRACDASCRCGHRRCVHHRSRWCPRPR